MTKRALLFMLATSAISCAFAQEAAPSVVPQTPADQFDQWLRSNNYAQNTPPNQAPASAEAPANTGATQTSITTTTTTTSGSDANNMQQPPATLPVVHAGHKPFTWEEGRQMMLDSLPPGEGPVDPDSEMAFNNMLQQNMPLTPRQMLLMHQKIDLSQRAASIAPNVPPKPVSTTLMMNLAPGTTPPAVRLAFGYVTSLVFVDSTGAPWPIASFDIGNPKAVTLQWDGKSNILLLQAIAPYSDGDIVIRLVGLDTPLTLELVAGQRVVDYRVDLHISGIGPNSKDGPAGTMLPQSANQLLLGVLDGVAPPGSKQLVAGADSQAWLLGDVMYLRTRMTVLSPGWVGKMVSPDGMIAYELPRTSSVLVSRYGEPAELKVEGF